MTADQTLQRLFVVTVGNEICSHAENDTCEDIKHFPLYCVIKCIVADEIQRQLYVSSCHTVITLNYSGGNVQTLIRTSKWAALVVDPISGLLYYSMNRTIYFSQDGRSIPYLSQEGLVRSFLVNVKTVYVGVNSKSEIHVYYNRKRLTQISTRKSAAIGNIRMCMAN